MPRQVRMPRRRKSAKQKNRHASTRSWAPPELEIHGIGARIRFLRRQREMTLDQLSSLSNLTKSYVSKVERGLSVPSISTAMKIADSFNITVSQLLGEDGYDDAVSIVRKNERRSFMGAGSSSSYDYELIAAPKKYKSMEPFIMKPPLEFQDKHVFEHAGEELIFVLSGSVEIELSGKLVRLDSGDTMYFDAYLPHRTRSVGSQQASVLVVIVGMKQS
jgi:transcriptional regulator with XRE-family HTH domain